jgi:hypothetical protein
MVICRPLLRLIITLGTWSPRAVGLVMPAVRPSPDTAVSAMGVFEASVSKRVAVTTISAPSGVGAAAGFSCAKAGLAASKASAETPRSCVFIMISSLFQVANFCVNVGAGGRLCGRPCCPLRLFCNRYQICVRAQATVPGKTRDSLQKAILASFTFLV